ncbi:type I restriction-modification system endonuclease [Chthonobacter rhizosphaerae]|uniref:type I restriction-modification system endonuclease n=1 Tax=Chthonobacter rhizosphaerae TaxID=2735553 RepID=UPI0015EE9E0F|nr:type I restriction-modification system endonuclease [Chthonobacter rhizosphaerae]
MGSNFAFLEEVEPQLARLGRLAELLFHQDAPTSIVKTRQLSELVAKQAAARAGIELMPREGFEEVLRRLRDSGLLPREVADVFHFVRRAGNAAVHENVGTLGEALTALKMGHGLAVWFYRTFAGQPSFRPGPFRPPTPPPDATEELRAEIGELHRRLAESETVAQRATRRAEEERRARETADQQYEREQADRIAAEQLLDEVEAARHDVERELSRLRDASVPEREAALPMLQNLAETAATVVVLDEADTRRLIDDKLRQAGWKVDSDLIRYGKGSRPADAEAIAIAEWPTESGPVDYALFLRGRCVGVIEAKRQAVTVPSVLVQAQRYARDIKLAPEELDFDAPYQHGLSGAYRVPFVFATNGRPFVKQLVTMSGIWFWDARRETNASVALPEWFSPRDLEERLQQASSAAEGLAEEGFDYAGLRPYQQEAITAVEAAIAEGRRDVLVSMATGTGKTRMCIVLMYRLLKHKRFRRILFLVDRSALGEQTIQAMQNTELEGLRRFAEIYGVAGPEKRSPEKTDRVHVATVQAMVKRIFHAEDEDQRPTPGLYDAIVVDEAHRGYVLDAELRDEDIGFRDLDDYLSQYRRVLDHFDATKVALTATPALHTTEIFGRPVFNYGYRQAVVDGYLIDHLPPRRITTALSQTGIQFEASEEVEVIDPRTGQIDLFETPDAVNFEVQAFNRKVYTEEFNRVVAEAVVAEVPPDRPGKTLIFAARDDHAEILVTQFRKALTDLYGPQPDGTVVKITGSVDRPSDLIKRFRNDPLPKYVVTVDLLTTGVDIPEICNLVFVRRVNSRILYDQMIGRATRKADHIGKEVFRIFDAVDIYASLQAMTDMRPVVIDPTITLAGLVSDLRRAETDEDRVFVRDQIVVRARQHLNHTTPEAAETIETLTGIPARDLANRLRTMPPAEIVALFEARPELVTLIQNQAPARPRPPGIYISTHEDELVSVTDIFEGVPSPEDYITAFERYVRENINLVPALTAAAQRPRELTRKDLRELATLLDGRGFSEAKLRRAYGTVRNADIAAHIIGFIRQAAVGDPLVPYATRVQNAIARMKASRSWTAKQRQWLDRIGRALKEQPVGDPTILDAPAFQLQGGFKAADREFENGLGALLQDINAEIWGKPAA